MCQRFTFFQLCGHVCSYTNVRCYDSIDARLAQRLEEQPPSHPCADITYANQILPDVCADCDRLGVIGDWLHTRPEERFSILRDWKQSLREFRRTAILGELETACQDSDTMLSPSPTHILFHEGQFRPVSIDAGSAHAVEEEKLVCSVEEEDQEMERIKVGLEALKDRVGTALRRSRAWRNASDTC